MKALKDQRLERKEIIMKLKEIKPGMVIHCKNDTEKKLILEEAERLGYVWCGSRHKPTSDTFYTGSTIHFYEKCKYCNYKHITWSDRIEGVTEFSDLIEPELTAKEALKIFYNIRQCDGRDCEDCPLSSVYNGGITLCTHEGIENDNNIDKLLKICQMWKEQHEKKEPELEWVYRVFGAESIGAEFFETEEEAIKRCEELVKLQPAKKYERYEKVCRIKE